MRTAKRTKFNELPTTKKGDAGELIIEAHLHAQGWHVFPHMAGIAAAVDIVAMRPKEDGFDVISVEVKTYPRCHSYERTGIDAADYWTYREVIKVLKLTIVFVDPFEQCIYALQFHKAHDRVTFDRNKCYFDLSDCQKMRNLTKAELSRINWRSTTYYTNVQKYFQ
ncbi:hypothetical protein [Haliscomenobacter sp.]|uniref:hypothetical protein n=1 Tax=Haliscomenobacter sp. TaxID=2717303 RepID=UPI003BACA8EF